MSSGARIEGMLLLNISNFSQSLSTAKAQLTSFANQSNTSFSKLNNGISKTTPALSAFDKKINEAQSSFGYLNTSSKKATDGMNQTKTSIDRTRDSMNKANNATQSLSGGMGMLKMAAASLISVLGMRLATDIMTVANTAINADSQIRAMGRGMGWTTTQTDKFLKKGQELQSVYRKTDMNAVSMEVAKMARIYKLNNEEATNFIETSAIFSSAMAQEGRTARDSALALKDLIDQGQGWERRMGEIGVTAEALKNTGLWHGDKEDKKGLIGALQKVLEERQLDKMAKEVNNLDDALKVLTTSGGQLLGAFLIPLTPYIYQLTKGLADLAYAGRDAIGWLSDGFKGLPDWAQTAVKIGAVSLALGGVGIVLGTKIIPAIMTLQQLNAQGGMRNILGNILGVGKDNVGTIGRLGLVAAAIGAITFAMYELGKAMGWWKDFDGMLNNTGAQIALIGSSVGLIAWQFSGIFGKIAGWAGLGNVFTSLAAKIGLTTVANEGLNKSLSKSGLFDPTSGAGGKSGKGGKGGKSLGFKDTIKGDLKGIGRGTIGAAAGIAAGMFLATEALLLLQGPMWALAELGKSFKAQEVSVRAGGEAFKIVGSVLAFVLPPIIAFTYLMGSTGNSAFVALVVGSVGAAAGIAIAMGLATEAIYLMKAPLWAIGELGKDFLGNQGNIESGLGVFKLISDTLVECVPLITAFSLAVVLFGTIPLAGLFAAAGIAITLGLLNMAIDGLKEPLRKIGELGGEFNNLDQVKAGADAIKRAAEAVGYIADIKVDIAKMNLADGISTLVEIFTGQKENLKTLTAENGVLADIKEFINNFNKATEGMPSINNVGALKNVVAVVKDISTLSTDIEKALTSTNKAKGEALFLNGLESGDDSPFNAMGKIIESTINFTRDLKSKLARLPELGDVSSQMTSLKNVTNVVQQVGNVVKEMNTAMSSLNSLKSTSSTSNYSSMDNIGLSFITGILGKDNGGSSPFVRMGKMIESIINFMKDINLKLANVPEIDSGAIERFRSLTSQFGYVKNDIINITNGLIAFNNVGSEYGDSPFNRMGNMVSSVINFMNNIKMYMTQATDVGEIGSTFRGIASQFGYIANDVTRISNQLVAFNSSGTDYGDKPFERMGKLVEGAIAFIKDINSKLSNAGDVSSSAGGITSAVQAISTAINQIKTALNNAAGIEGAAKNLGAKIPAGIKAGIGNVSGSILAPIITAIQSRYATFQSAGNASGKKFASGLKIGIAPASDYMVAEVTDIINAVKSRYDTAYAAGKALGAAFARGHKAGLERESPGLAARETLQEVKDITQFISQGVNPLYESSSMLGQAIVSGFGSPSLEVGDTEGLNQVQMNAQTAMGLVQNTADTTTSTFAGVNTTLQGSFIQMALNARNTFTGVNTTSTAQMKDMAGKTGSEIGNIKSSWVGMQEALINSASHIRSQTGKHIDKLQGNMASFWRKVRSPVLLLGGAAGGYAGSPSMSRAVTSSITRPRLSSRGFAGNPLADENITGNRGMSFLREDTPFPCFSEDCFAGWQLQNWTPSLKTSMGKWNTNFGHVYDPYLNVGKFANSNFPVKGNANVFKAFILDAIGKTAYQFYYNSKGGSPASIYSSGSFNCWDGYHIVQGFANAFGLPCSMERGSWNGIPHVWANVGGVGRVDATAIQNSRGSSLFNSSAVAGGPSPSSLSQSEVSKTVTNHVKIGDIKITLEGVSNQEELLDGIEGKLQNVVYKIVNDTFNGE